MTTNAMTVREPWPDEMPRVQHFLRAAFLFDAKPYLLVAVSGRVERFIGALALTSRPLAQMSSSWLALRVPNEHPVGPQLLQRGLEEAWRQDAAAVYFAQTVREGSFAETALRTAGFVNAAAHEVYEVEARPLFDRVHRIYQRMHARNMFPENVQIMTLQRTLTQKVRKFLREALPGSASTLAHETAGYKAEHSLVLLQDGEVKGVLLGRRHGNIALTGLRVVAKELQGGVGWANILLMHTSLASGIQTGLHVARFEFDPEMHHDTQQFARLHEARLVAKRLLLKINNPKKVVDAERTQHLQPPT
jgi:hypothetical protein